MSIAGHPIHPQIIPFPIAFTFGAALSDLLHLWRRSDTWYNVSTWSVLLGTIGGAAAAVPGAIDFFTSLTVGAHRPAAIHALLNGSFIGTNSVNAAMRVSGRARSGRGLATALMMTAIGAGLLGVSGWLGGDIVYRHGVAVEPAPPHKHRPGDPREPWQIAA